MNTSTTSSPGSGDETPAPDSDAPAGDPPGASAPQSPENNEFAEQLLDEESSEEELLDEEQADAGAFPDLAAMLHPFEESELETDLEDAAAPSDAFAFEEFEADSDDDEQQREFDTGISLGNLEEEQSGDASEDEPSKLNDLNFNFDDQPYDEQGDADGVIETFELGELPPLDADADSADAEPIAIESITLPEDSNFEGKEDPRFRLMRVDDEEIDCMTPGPSSVLAAGTRVWSLSNQKLAECAHLVTRAKSLALHAGELWLTTYAGQWYRAAVTSTDELIDEPDPVTPSAIADQASLAEATLHTDGHHLYALTPLGRLFVHESETRFVASDETFAGSIRPNSKLALLRNHLACVDPQNGLRVSSDRGQHFHSVPGCGQASAVCLGQLDEQVIAWVAISEVGAGTTIIEIAQEQAHDPSSAAIVARLDLPPDVEELLVQALAWDPTARCLYIATNSGLHTLKRLEG